ncbi:hypothetical protein F751_0182 [Auxenochlorella protothecoides]|uniref:Uncharacterized protein n=1 Tax=Auxenochlorella protothecoides TaxID=3075 RepID=A0A087S9J3_AUXPR|nr:hypothetical protein F751_0182 [Auxenochlorella protothecoides]KFM22397.1 hypothetical protein F751_0182 [Auxenochlorella protothecoides]
MSLAAPSMQMGRSSHPESAIPAHSKHRPRLHAGCVGGGSSLMAWRPGARQVMW